MNIKLKYTMYLATLALLFSSCSKESNEESIGDGLENSIWVPTMTDANPSTNPRGEIGMNSSNQYYPWSECQMDDTFSFTKDRWSIDDNGTACENGLDYFFDTQNQPYSYNAERKQLTVGSGNDMVVFDVYELSKDRLKLRLTIPIGASMGNIVFLFERK